MKKQAFPLLLAITGIFLAFLMGLFLGRNTAKGDILVSGLSAPPLHAGQEPETAPEETAIPAATITFPLDVNMATKAELMALPGIGETLAQRILDYRIAHGPFSRPEELMNVSGIGAGKLEPILDLITTGG